MLSDDAVAAFARWSLRCLPQARPSEGPTKVVLGRAGALWSLSVFTVFVTGAGAVRQR